MRMKRRIKALQAVQGRVNIKTLAKQIGVDYGTLYNGIKGKELSGRTVAKIEALEGELGLRRENP